MTHCRTMNMRTKKEYNLYKDEMNRQNEGVSSTGFTLGSIGFKYASLPSTTANNLKNKREGLVKKLKLLDSVMILMSESKDIALNRKYKYVLDSLRNAMNFFGTNSNIDTGLVYYISLKGFSKKDFYNKFFIQNNRYYMAEVVVDSTKKVHDGLEKFAHYQRTELAYRYNEKESSLQKPITKSTYKLFENLTFPFIIITTLLMSYFFIGLFVQLLYNIAKGKVFTAKNISNLTSMMFAILIYTSVRILAPSLFKWLLFSGSEKYFQSDLLSEVILENFSLIIITVTIFAVRAAFKKGYKLQQEQSLTI